MGNRLVIRTGCPLAIGIISGAALSAPCGAQQAPPAATAVQTGEVRAPTQDDTLADIVVTAQRTSESLVRAPLAITAIGGEDLAKQQITGVAALTASVPNFSFGTYGGTARLAIRGVGFDAINPGAEGRVAYYVDGVYFSRPATTASGFFDIARVEVLRGPQGTLYGRNATAGALNISTQDPGSTLKGYYNQTIGNYGALSEEGAVSVPLSPKVSARVAVRFENRDGYGRNLLTGHDVDDANTQSVRAKLRFEPNSALTVLLAGDYHRERDRNYASHYGGQAYPDVFPVSSSVLASVSDNGAPAPDNIRDVASQKDPFNRREFWGTSLTATHEGDVTVRSITAYRHSDYSNRFGTSTGAAFLLTLSERASQISQELQLSGRTGALRWVAGVYGFHEDVRGSVDIPTGTGALQAFGIPAPSNPSGYTQGYWAGGKGRTDTLAGFGQATYEIVPKLEFTVGLRVGWERKTSSDAQQLDLLNPYVRPNPVTTLPLPSVNPIGSYRTSRGEIKETSVTPKFSLSYRPLSTVNLYATVAKGTKSGGFDIGATSAPFREETLWDYEAGLKAELFDRRVRIGVAGFYYDYTDLQVSLVRGNVVYTENAATARSYGVEGELEAIVAHGLKLKLSGGYLNARFKDYVTADPYQPNSVARNYKGNRLTQSPTFQGKTGAEYAVPLLGGELTIRGDVEYASRVYFTPFNIERASQAGVARQNAGIDFTSGSETWHAGAFIRNISNETVVSTSTVSSALSGLPLVSYLAPPRTYGVTFGVSF